MYYYQMRGMRHALKVFRFHDAIHHMCTDPAGQQRINGFCSFNTKQTLSLMSLLWVREINSVFSLPCKYSPISCT